MGNTVNPENFNETCKGYLKKAIKIAHENDADYTDNLTDELEKRLLNSLRWALDGMSMSEARKYCAAVERLDLKEVATDKD